MIEINKNKKSYFDYEILDIYDAGVVLLGSEVKAIRAKKVNLKDSFIRIIKGEAFLLNAHISYLDTTNPHYKPDPRRPRKLLLNRKEINKIGGKSSINSLAVVPLMIYINNSNLIKVKIALAKGKKLYDKRESIKERDLNREANANFKNYAKL